MLKVVAYLIPALLKLLKPELLKSAIIAMLNHIEEKVEKTENKYDDAIIIPMIELIKQAINQK